MKLIGTPSIVDNDPFTNVNTANAQEHNLGEFLELGDGRAFRFGKAGAADTAPGKMGVAPTPKTNHHNCVAIVSTAGTFTPTFTLGATATVAGEYNEGWITTNVTPDVGRTYKVSSMGLIGSGGTATPTLFEPIVTDWSTATKVSLVHNTWSGVVEGTIQTKRAAGVAMVTVTTVTYGWYATRGATAVLADGTIALGSLIGVSGSVAGAVIVNSGTYATALAITQVGQASVMAGVTAEYRPMVLKID